MPTAEPQMATVVRNDDPRGIGRVQVRMNWQTDNMQTGWIRVMTPDAGSSDKVNTNRGFVFIPEVDDKVLVGFRNGDPNRPYVMGSLFNGYTAAGGGEGNKIKSITTRSGSTLKLDDGDGSLFMQDKGGANMNFDGAGNHTLNAAASTTTSVGKNGESVLTMDSQGNINLRGKQQITLAIGNSKITISETEIKIESSTINANGTTCNINGTTNVTGITTIKAGEGAVIITGNPVKVN